MDNPTYEPIIPKDNTPLTKADIAQLLTKTELKNTARILRQEIKAEVQILKQEMNERFNELPTRNDFSNLLSAVDGLTVEVKKYNTERASETYRLERTEKWIKQAAEVVKIPFQL